MAKKKSKVKTEVTPAKTEMTPAESEQAGSMTWQTQLSIVIITSFLAQRIWILREFFTQDLYTDEQTPMERNLIQGFEFVVTMGIVVLVGFIVGKVISKFAGE